MFRRFIFAALFALAFASPAAAQSCNDPSGFLKTSGPFLLGDILTLGPDCQHTQSFGFGLTTGWISASSFGVKCDGITDDTAAMNAAFVGSIGKVLSIQPGVCMVNPLSITDTLGNVPQAIFAYGTTFKAIAVSASPTLLVQNPHVIINGFSLYGLKFDANSKHGNPLKIRGGQFMYYRDIEVLNGATGGMWLAPETGFGIYSSMFENIRIRGNAGAGLIAKSTNNAGNYLLGANHFIGIDSQVNGTYGADLDFVSVAFYASLFQSNGTCGVNMDHIIQYDSYGVHYESNPNNTPGCAITGTVNSLNGKIEGGRLIGTVTNTLLTHNSWSFNTSGNDPTTPIIWHGGINFALGGLGFGSSLGASHLLNFDTSFAFGITGTAKANFSTTGLQLPAGSGLSFGSAAPIDGSINAPVGGLSTLIAGTTKSTLTATAFNIPTGVDYTKNGAAIPETVTAPLALSAGGVLSVTSKLLIGGTVAANAVAQNATSFFTNNNCAGIEGSCAIPMNIAGTIKGCTYGTSVGAPPAGQTATFTLRKNGADTTNTGQVTNGSTVTGGVAQVNDNTHTVSYSAGDVYTVKVITSATSGSLGVQFQCEYDSP